MAVVDSGIIYLRRGDTETLSVSAKQGTTAYTFQVGDVVTFTVREIPNSTSSVLLTASTTVAAAGTSVDVTIAASTMSAVPAGRYSCDVQLNSDGVIKTLFPITDVDNPRYKEKNWKNCVIEGEVTYNG